MSWLSWVQPRTNQPITKCRVLHTVKTYLIAKYKDQTRKVWKAEEVKGRSGLLRTKVKNNNNNKNQWKWLNLDSTQSEGMIFYRQTSAASQYYQK